MDVDEGWIKPVDKIDAEGITISSIKKEKVVVPERIEKRITAITYQEGDTFQIAKNGRAMFNREVPGGYQFTVYVRVVIEKTSI